MAFEDSPFSERVGEFNKIKLKYPNAFPVIVEKNKKSDIQSIDKTKYIVQKDIQYCQFVNIIRRRLNLKPQVAIFMTINGNLAPSNATISKIYETYKRDDGFIYMEYSAENTFG